MTQYYLATVRPLLPERTMRYLAGRKVRLGYAELRGAERRRCLRVLYSSKLAAFLYNSTSWSYPVS